MSIAKSIVKSNANVSKSYKRLDSGSWCKMRIIMVLVLLHVFQCQVEVSSKYQQ